MRGQRVGEPLGAAARHGPADGVRADGEHDPERRAQRRLERQHRVSAAAGQQRSRALAGEAAAREPGRRPHRPAREAGEGQRVPRRPQRPEQVTEQRPGLPHERLDHAAVGRTVGPEAGRRLRDRALEQHRRPVVERMRQRSGGMRELEPVLGERQAPEQRRRLRQSVHGRARVVHEAGQGQLGRAAAAADRRLALQDGDAAPGGGQHDGGGEPVRAGADDGRRPAHRRSRTAACTTRATASETAGRRLR